MNKLLIATTNSAKFKEIKGFLEDFPIELVSLTDVGISTEFEETGTTYYENSEGKARFYSELSGLPALSDDGGIEIDAFNGEPGVQSRYWFGEALPDEVMIEKIKEKTKDIPDNNRGARFRAVVTVVFPGGEKIQEEGVIEGIIAKEPLVKINRGYPYRSFFYLPEIKRFYHESDLTPEQEKLYNHRYKAIQKLKPKLKEKL